MQTATLLARLDTELAIDAYAELDASANGLQVGTEAGTVATVGFAVDAAVTTIETAAERDVDLLVVHHGLSWGGIDRITDRTYRRIEALVANDIDLYAAHLPLDGHQEYGNAAGIADVLSMTDREPFGTLGDQFIGQRGRLPEPQDQATIRETLAAKLAHDGTGIRVLPFGPDRIESIAIVTGSGTDWFDEAVAADVDAFITGEPKGKLYHMAKEAGVTVFLGGHYATETFGIEALAEVLASWGLETTVIDAPTGL